MRLKLLACAGLALAITACAPTSRFEWGNYENTLYALYQNPEAETAYEDSLRRAIERGAASDRVAPGMHAELGYLLHARGDVAAAREQFAAEMALFPESRVFLERFMGGPSQTPAAPAAADAAALNS
ncbi:MAG: DUF4810 domain-containing protein [Oceanicaulis sp.]